MTGVAQGISPAAPTRADRHHESVGFHHAAVGHLDAYRPLHQHRPRRNDPHDAWFGGVGHGLSALITNSSSSRLPGSRRPVSSIHSARDVSTGPNGIH